MSALNGWTRQKLLALPGRKWDDDSRLYDSLLVFSARRKHDSGWSQIVVVGCIKQQPVEICVACADDLEWLSPPPIVAGETYRMGQMRTDCLFPAGILHAWSREHRFKVGAALSSVTIELVRIGGAP